MDTKLGPQAKIEVRVYRAATGRWDDELELGWRGWWRRIKNFFRLG